MKTIGVWSVFIFLSGTSVMSQENKSVTESKTKVIYPQNPSIDFEGLSLDGELKNPGEFYFQNRAQEGFDPLTKRRSNFHREMLRDSVQSN